MIPTPNGPDCSPEALAAHFTEHPRRNGKTTAQLEAEGKLAYLQGRAAELEAAAAAPKATAQDALDAVYVAIVRATEKIPHPTLDGGAELSALASLVGTLAHEARQEPPAE